MKKNLSLPILFCVMLVCTPIVSATPSFLKSIASYFKPDEHKQHSETIALSKTTGTVTVHNTTGAITVVGSNDATINIESTIKGPAEKINNTKVVTKKNKGNLSIETVSKTTEPPFPVFYTITMPKTMTLIIEQQKGNIVINNINGMLTLQTDDGSIVITQATESITARTPHGNVSIDLENLLPQASIFVEAQGKISLSLPPYASARLSAHTDHGFVSSELPLTLDAITLSSLDKKTWDGLRRCIEGIFGSGEASLVLSANGSITITDRTAS